LTEKLQLGRSGERVKAIGNPSIDFVKKINLVKQQNSDGFVVTPVVFAGV
jgi:hypothetical protein